MDEVVSKLELLTSEFVKQLDTTDMEAITSFVEQRQLLIDELAKLQEQANLFEEEETDSSGQQTIVERLKHILTYDKLINDKMQHFMDHSMQQINKINQTKKREAAYNPTYSPDSVYFDKKK